VEDGRSRPSKCKVRMEKRAIRQAGEDARPPSLGYLQTTLMFSTAYLDYHRGSMLLW